MIRNPQPATSQPSPEHNLKKYVAKENVIKIIFKKGNKIDPKLKLSENHKI